MIIKNIDRIDHLYQFKAKIYDFARTMNSVVASMDITFLQLFAVQVLVLFPFISILFKYEDYFPPVVSQVFRSLLVSNLIDRLGVSQTLVYSLIIAIYLIVVLFTLFHFTFETVLAPISNVLGILIKISHLLIVPLADTAVYSYYDMIDQNRSPTRRLIGGITAFLIVVSIVIICLQSFFEIRMLRKKTVFWCLDNSFHFYGLIFTVFKTVSISTQSISTRSICIISIGFYLYHSRVFKGIVGQAQRFIEASLDMYIVITDAAVFTSIVTHNQNLAFGLWLSGIAFAMTVSIIIIYQRQHRKLFIPTCDSPPETFYNFYYCFREELKGDDGTGKEKTRGHPSFIFHLHRFHCKNNCRLKLWLSMSDERQIQSVVDTIITAKRNQTLHNRIVNELWNLQRGKKCNVSVLQDKILTIDQDFILYCIEKMTKDSEITIQSNETNKNTLTKIFYDLIYESANHYCLFYEELSRPQPVIDSLVNQGTQIHKKITKLKTIYWQLQKQKLINFKMIELYIEFLSRFVSEKALQKEDISQLIKLQQNVYFDDISEIYLPSLTFYRDTGKIQNANCEAQKFLQSTRFELKCKELSDITYPKLSVEELHDIGNRDELSIKQEPLFILFEKSEDSFSLGSINVCEKNIKGKKLLVMQISEDEFSSQKSVFLVTRSFELEVVLRKLSKVRSQFRERPLVVDWEDIFERYILENRNKIERSRITKISIDDWAIIVKKLQCAVPGYYILKAQVLFLNESDLERQRRKRNTVMSLQRSVSKYHQSNSFEFHYTQNTDVSKPLLIGMKGNENAMLQKMKLKTLTALEKQLNSILVDNVIKQQKNYAKGIKAYRLFDGDLYNIDLEDRAAYEQTFEGKVSKERQELVTDSSSFECYIAIAVVLLALTLIGLSAYYVIEFNNDSSAIVILSEQHTNIDSFLVDYYRILALLRNLNQETRLKFPNLSISKQIGDSFSRIEVLKTKPLFGSYVKQISFLGLKMRGTFVQLIDVIFAHVNEVINSGNETVIDEIQRTGVDLVVEMEAQQDEIFQEITQDFDTLTLLNNIILFCSIGVIAVLLFIFIYFCYRSTEKIKQKLSPLLFITDEEARIHQDNAAKIKYAVEMIRKNFQVDTQSLLISSIQDKRRKHPKKVMLSKGNIVTIIIVISIALAVHLSCLFIFSSQQSNSLQRFLKMKASSRAIIRAYGQQAEIANYYAETGQLEQDQMEQIAENLDFLSFQMTSLDYSPELNQFINTLYFQNSCSILMPMYNMSLEECCNTAPEFTLKNPFEVGLAFYLNRQFFYFYNNISQVYAHTSIHSARFAEILTNLSISFNSESTQAIFSIRDTVNVINYVLMGLSVCYIVTFFSVYYFFRIQAASIRQIIDFFREKSIPKPSQEVEALGNKINTRQNIESDREPQQRERQIEKIIKSTTLEKEIRFTAHNH